MGRKIHDKDHNARIYFRIRDDDKWSLIDKLMELPKYANSRTNLLNKALDYGLPKLIDEEFGEIKLCEEPNEQPTETSVACVKSDEAQDERMKIIIRLLQEIVINTEIGKSMLCSLFNEKADEIVGGKMREKFKRGGYRDTPLYLIKYEAELLNEIDEEE